MSGTNTELEQESTPFTERRPSSAAILLAVIFGVFLTAFLGSALNIAVRDIEREFSLSALSVTWLATAYMLCNLSFILISGWLGDRFRRDRVYLAGLIIACVTIALAALAPEGEMLIAMRALQGAGCSMVFANSMALVTESQPPGMRGRALGLTVAATYLGLSAGPSLGGLLIQNYGWRSIFVVSLICGVLAIAATLRIKAPARAAKEKTRLDRRGALLSIVTPACLVLGLNFLREGMAGAAILGAGLLLLLCFILHERALGKREAEPPPEHAPPEYRTRLPKKPLFDVRLLSENRMFSFSCLAAMLNYSATSATAFLLSIRLQYSMGYSEQTAGLILITQPIIQALFSPVFGALSDRFSSRILASMGMGTAAIAVLWFFMQGDSSLPAILFGLGMAGMGYALFSSPNSNAIMSSVEPRHYGFASSAVAFARTCGQLFSISIVGALFAFSFGDASFSALGKGELARGIDLSFLLMLLCIAPGIWFSLVRNKSAQEKCAQEKRAPEKQ